MEKSTISVITETKLIIEKLNEKIQKTANAGVKMQPSKTYSDTPPVSSNNTNDAGVSNNQDDDLPF